MPPDETDNPQPEIVTDEDWKSRVKAEDAALDEAFREKESVQETTDTPTEQTGGEPAASEPAASESAESSARKAESPSETPPLPPVGFSTLVAMFSTQAMVALGVIPNPVSGKPEQQLELAKHFIDLLGVVESKTRGNLDSSEQAMLDNTLHELRMAYIELSKTSS